jgi:hypothetical protein
MRSRGVPKVGDIGTKRVLLRTEGETSNEAMKGNEGNRRTCFKAEGARPAFAAKLATRRGVIVDLMGYILGILVMFGGPFIHPRVRQRWRRLLCGSLRRDRRP